MRLGLGRHDLDVRRRRWRRSSSGLPRLEVKFHDQYGDGDFKLATPLSIRQSTATQRMIASFITQPGLTKAPTFQAAARGSRHAGSASGAGCGLKTAALEAAVAEEGRQGANNRRRARVRGVHFAGR